MDLSIHTYTHIIVYYALGWFIHILCKVFCFYAGLGPFFLGVCAGCLLLSRLCLENQSLAAMRGLLSAVTSLGEDRLSVSQASAAAAHGLGSCGSRAQERRLKELRCIGLVALLNVGSSWTRDQTHVSCVGRQILYHWAREVLGSVLSLKLILVFLIWFCCTMLLLKVLFFLN